jgi:F-type H+-transporting ATPase subunit delta
MSAVKLASRYAKSLIDLAIEKNELPQVFADMQYTDGVLSISRELVVFLKSPVIKADKKQNVVEALFKDKVSEVTLAFFNIMIRKGREGYLPDVIKSFRTLYNTNKHITPVKITSAVKLEDSFVKDIVAKLKLDAHLETIEITTLVDESLIGGFIVQWEDKMIDNSISRNIKTLKKELSNNQYINLVYSNN